jgi:hypothetical protein
MSSGGGVRRTAVVLFTVGVVLVLNCNQGHRPDTAAVPSGPSSGAVGVSYTFSSSAEDRDGDDVAIRFDWGDGDTSDWSPWVRPGETVAMNHKWAASASFNVKAQARARNITVSDWSTALTLSRCYEWTRTFGGPNDDYCWSVRQTPDGGYIILRNTDSYGAGDAGVWLIKIDDAGYKVWERTVGGAGDDWGNSLQQTRDGGYVVTGYTAALGVSEFDVWFFKVDANGHALWQKTYRYAGGAVGKYVKQTQDGGYVVAAERAQPGGWPYDLWLIRTDSDGDTLWTRTYGGGSDEGAFWVDQTEDGGYAIAGYTSSFGAGEGDFWLVKADANGDTAWTKTFGGPRNDVCLSAGRTQDGGYILTGYTCSYGVGLCSIWLIKTDADGRESWNKALGGEDYNYGEAVQQTADGGYVVGSTSEDVWLITMAAEGDTVWSRHYAWAGGERCGDVQQTKDGGYIIAGRTSSRGAGRTDVLLMKTGPNGEIDEGGGK